MNTNSAVISRRNFIIGAAAAGGGFSLGFHVPVGAQSLAGSVEEVNAWVVVRPDESCVIRIARAEMGQGTHTGLAQLVAEELECDWRKVVLQPITAAQNLARKRVWRDMAASVAPKTMCVKAAQPPAWCSCRPLPICGKCPWPNCAWTKAWCSTRPVVDRPRMASWPMPQPSCLHRM